MLKVKEDDGDYIIFEELNPYYYKIKSWAKRLEESLKNRKERKIMKKKHKYVYILLEHAVTRFDFKDAKIHGVYLSREDAEVGKCRAEYDEPHDSGYMAILKFRIKGNL